ncbi:MAG TPA: response regulator transcription factor [Bryobacteraceae bacterium]|nr:response regulator transcription factor [Bryobacteraceae bacterium]
MRILLADDHTIVRQGVRALLEKEGFEVVAEAEDGREAVRLAAEVRPDMLVLDVVMPLLNGVDAARQILRDLPGTRAVLLSMHSEDRYVLEALRAGVSGFVLKTRAVSALVEAINEVAKGNTYLSPGVSRAVIAGFLNPNGGQAMPLSARERQVLQLIAEGKATKEVAGLLGLSVKTAESHRARIMEKLDIHDTAGLVRYAIRQGMIEP